MVVKVVVLHSIVCYRRINIEVSICVARSRSLDSYNACVVINVGPFNLNIPEQGLYTNCDTALQCTRKFKI
jgi:hypothetical protein